MNEDSMLKPALIGGVLLGILSALPLINYFNCICCAWVILGSVVAARLVREGFLRSGNAGAWRRPWASHRRDRHHRVRTLLDPPDPDGQRGGSGIMEQMKQALEQVPNLPPETREAIESLVSQGNISTVIYIVGFFFTLVLNCLVAMIGGAIGVAIFEKRKTGSSQPEPPPYQPPADSAPAAHGCGVTQFVRTEAGIIRCAPGAIAVNSGERVHRTWRISTLKMNRRP